MEAQPDEKNKVPESSGESSVEEETLPPILDRRTGQLEVYGFNARQRKAFYDAVMRFGMPTSDLYKSQWMVRDLRSKSEEQFKAYSAMFVRHLSETKFKRKNYFDDNVPFEGLNRDVVLARIGIMALIRRKVQVTIIQQAERIVQLLDILGVRGR